MEPDGAVGVVKELLLALFRSGDVMLQSGRIYVDGQATDVPAPDDGVRRHGCFKTHKLGERKYLVELTATGLAWLVKEGLVEITGRFTATTSLGGLSMTFEIESPKVQWPHETRIVCLVEEGLAGNLLGVDRDGKIYRVAAL